MSTPRFCAASFSKTSSALAAGLLLLAAGCAEMGLDSPSEVAERPFKSTSTGATAGAVIGGGVGAVIGSTSGHLGEGLAVGSLAGGAVGAAIGHQVSANSEKSAHAEQAMTGRGRTIDQQKREITQLRRGMTDESELVSGRPSTVSTSEQWQNYRGNPNAKPFGGAAVGAVEGRAMYSHQEPPEPAALKPTPFRTAASSEVKTPEAKSVRSVIAARIAERDAAAARGTGTTVKPSTAPAVQPARAVSSQGFSDANLILPVGSSADSAAPEPELPKAAPKAASLAVASAPASVAPAALPEASPHSALPPARTVAQETDDSYDSNEEEEPGEEEAEVTPAPVKETIKQAKAVPAETAKPAATPKATAEKPAAESPKPAAKAASAQLNTEECGKAKEEEGRAAKAKSIADKLFYYRRALRLCPANASYHMEIGRLYQAIGRSEDAKAEFKQATDLDPSIEQAKAETAAPAAVE